MGEQALVVAHVRVAGLAATLLPLAACAPDDSGGKDSESVEPAPLAPVGFGIAINAVDGAFRSTCTMNASLTDSDGNLAVQVPLSPADGGLWAGSAITAGTQYKALLGWSNCVNTSAGTGTQESSTFSGGDGDLFVMHYNGVSAGFEWMVQGTDHLGGEVHVQFASTAAAADVDALVSSMGLASREDPDDASFRYLTWTDDQNVADVLGQLSASELYAWGEPTWVEQPSWW